MRECRVNAFLKDVATLNINQNKHIYSLNPLRLVPGGVCNRKQKSVEESTKNSRRTLEKGAEHFAARL